MSGLAAGRPLGKAKNAARHPAAPREEEPRRAPAPVVEASPAPEAAAVPESTPSAPPAGRVSSAPVSAPGSGRGGGATAARAEGAPETNVVPLAPGRGAAVDVPASQRSRRKVVSLRGKRGYNYEWPKVDVQVLQEAYEELRRPYRRYWEDRDPQGTYRLTRSAFLSRAMEVALASPGEWLSQVRNSGTRAPVAGGSKQVYLIWDVQLDEQVVDAFETAARERGEDGFVMTKQRFAVAGLLWAVGSAQEWYLSCENDDRLREPTAQDGRRSAPVEDGADS